MKSYYQMLGASPGATPEELRHAWLLRTRVLHPDRWDARTHPVEWEHAGRMLAELNEAYEVLRDPVRRARYDDALPADEVDDGWRADVAPSAELQAGHAAFGDLPPATRRRLLERQAGRVEHQFRVSTAEVRPHYLVVALFPVWAAQLLFTAFERRWTAGEWGWQAALTVAVALVAARSLEILLRWRRGALKPFFYFTPLYLIRTARDEVWYWPIRDVRRFETVRRRRGTVLEVVMEGGTESVPLARPNQAATVVELVHLWTGDLRHAERTGDAAYFAAHDDFSGFAPPPAAPPARDRLRMPSLGALGLAALLLLAASILQSHHP